MAIASAKATEDAEDALRAVAEDFISSMGGWHDGWLAGWLGWLAGWQPGRCPAQASCARRLRAARMPPAPWTASSPCRTLLTAGRHARTQRSMKCGTASGAPPPLLSGRRHQPWQLRGRRL